MTELGWQPIETAPRDGTHVLTFSPDASTPIAAGWWIYSDSGDDDDLGVEGTWREDGSQPTHWMPLPEPPEPA